MSVSKFILLRKAKGGADGMPGRIYRVILWSALLTLLAVIFAFSAQPGTQSNELTEAAVMPLAELLASVQEGGEETVELLYIIIGSVVRKVAHVLEYALLGLLIQLLLCAYGIQNRWLSVALGVAYAITDEVHQAFVPGRLGTPVDVLIDAAGVIIGVFAVKWISEWRKNHVHDQ